MLDKFIKEHIGKKNDNGYGAYPGECVSLVQRFNKALGNPRQWGNGEAYRTNLVNNKLGVHVPLNQARSGDIIAGLNNSHIYGHVALVINNTQVLEQAGPTAGGDGIAKVGTIANFVKRYPNYKVTRLHAYKYVEPIVNNKEVAQNGILKADLGTNINIRKEPSTKSSVVGKLVIGNEIAYSAYIDNENIRWAKTNKGYVAVRELNGVKFGTARFAKENKPVNNIVVGSKVKIKQGSFYQGSAKGKPVSAYAYSKAWKVLEIKGNIAKLDNINSWLAIKDLVKVN